MRPFNRTRRDRIPMNRAVAVTGVGWVTPLGWGIDTVWEQLLAGKSGIGPIRSFDAANFPTRIAGEVPQFDPCDWIEPRVARRLDRFVQFALAAAKMAVADAGIAVSLEDSYRAGAIIGSGTVIATRWLSGSSA